MIPRVTPSEVRSRLSNDEGPLLVCAYEQEEKCKALRIDGSLTLSEFMARSNFLPRNREIVFYCG